MTFATFQQRISRLDFHLVLKYSDSEEPWKFYLKKKKESFILTIFLPKKKKKGIHTSTLGFPGFNRLKWHNPI